MSKVIAALRNIWAKEPARVITVLTAAVVFVAAEAGVVVPQQSVGSALALILPILLGGEAIRSQVSPVK